MSEDYTEEIEAIESVINHIQNVHRNCIILGKKLINDGKPFLGRMLIYNGFQHDISKFLGAEWEYLRLANKKKLNKDEKLGINISIKSHSQNNQHHPEFWGGIEKMPEVHLAEMVCDWGARAMEFGTSLEDWIKEEAMKRFGFKEGDEVYQKIFYFMGLLYNKPFEPIK